MKATAYSIKRIPISAENVITEKVNATIAALNEAEGVRFDRMPYWELDHITALGDDELLVVYSKWEFEQHN